MGPLRDSIDTRLSLERRREALSQQVAELHWDLGGLTYEMAIRDHFRLDVLVRRAAVLQERDAELAEVERLLSSPRGAGRGALPVLLGAPQPRRPVLLAVWPAADGGTARLARRALAERPVRRLPRPTLEGVRLPPRKVMAVLVLAFLGFGVLIGRAARNYRPGGRSGRRRRAGEGVRAAELPGRRRPGAVARSARGRSSAHSRTRPREDTELGPRVPRRAPARHRRRPPSRRPRRRRRRSRRSSTCS